MLPINIAFNPLSDEQLLDKLAEERNKFSKCDEAAMLEMTEELQARGVYPKETSPGNPNSVFRMVSGWGARWHVWSGVLNCPHCNADFRSEAGPPFLRCNERVDYGTRRMVYKCPDCKKESQ